MFADMQGVRKNLITNIVQLVYFMRGSIQYKDMMDMSLVEREAVSDFISTRLEQESKKQHPQY